MTPFMETVEQAAEFAQSAVEKLRTLEIAATPNNFAVWYGYFAGRDAAMTQALDIVLSNKVELTPERCEEIYEKYIGFGKENAELRENTNRLEAMIQGVLEQVDQAGKDQGSYGKKLAGFSSVLSKSGGSDMADLVKGILNDTRQIMEKNQALESRLGESSQEISDLRQHLEEVRREAMTDALTGIANRKYFDVSLREEAAQAQDEGDELCLLLMDIDHFKKFNDTYGHLIGDEVLKAVARIMKDGVKGRDTAARYGGEEFVIILPNTKLDDAKTVADQIRQNLASRKLKNRKTGESYGVVTLSVGAAVYRSGESLESFVQRADQALYRAKAEGRNRVITETMMDEVVSLAG